MEIRIRRYRPEDCLTLTRLFYETVRRANLGDYTQDQVEAWAPAPPEEKRWAAMLLDHESWVAEGEDGILGFATLDGDYFDHLSSDGIVRGKAWPERWQTLWKTGLGKRAARKSASMRLSPLGPFLKNGDTS